MERAARPITIPGLEILEQAGPTDWVIRVRCSKGTYVRTLCHDIGEALGCGGCMYSLRRTMAAGFTLADAVTLEEVQEKKESLLLPMDRFFAEYEAVTLTAPRQLHLCGNGNAVPFEGLRQGALYRVYDPEGAFLCLSRYEKGLLISEKNFFSK